ncbi:hypothetical protein Nm8I071_56860 [Nonomuraea sp. TT08I-71]|nr:hypothetical protein Nm8I071_56860 [Nonomuraea sp. TT08I-71]
MTTDQLWDTSGGDSGPRDIVGARVLVGIQMVDISRLSTHPIPVTSEGLITVAGQGPKDSNGAGKSSFIAALSLLHADDQWRLASGAASAAELLFTAELAAQEARWSNADRGYIIGVFASPTAQTLDDLQTSVLTVWLRINRRAPYLDLRWTKGLHVPVGASEDERVRHVDALWEALPRSNGRTDFHANRLATVLYGTHVRCVSFLSTSVRASPTANLLAQPLNDLRPERIFDAIATLTGLDRELEDEQSLRSTEHSHRAAVQEAERDLDTWEQEVAVVEAGIEHRARARELLGAAKVAWHGRCARFFVNGVDRSNEIRGELAILAGEEKEHRAKLDGLEGSLATLRDDTTFAEHFKQLKRRHEELAGRERDLEREQDKTGQRIEDLTKRLRQLREQAQGADGRSLEQAQQEEHRAEREWTSTIEARGVAEAAQGDAVARLTAAEAGDDVAIEPMRRLRVAGIPAAVLLDIVSLDPEQRAMWEPRLVPYRTAVVVSPVHQEQAYSVLGDLPEVMLILADPPESPTAPGTQPVSADARFTVSRFLNALADRAGADQHDIDSSAGIVVLGTYPEPITGRAARVAVAREELAVAASGLASAQERVTEAERILRRARGRTAAAKASELADDITKQVEHLRRDNRQREEQRAELLPELTKADREYQAVRVEQETRAERKKALTAEAARVRKDLKLKEEQRDALEKEGDGLDLAGRQAAWGETADAANRYLLSLSEHDQLRTVADWNEEAVHRLNEVVRLCFPDDTPPEQMTAEVRELLVEQRWRRGGLEIRVRLATGLLRALHTHLTNTEQQDRYDKRQIEEQRSQRTGDLAAAQQGLTEAARASEVHRSSLAAGIKAKLKKVADEFERLDQQYGGYGAGLDYPEPEPPSQPDRPWRWSVTPKWRRAEGQRMAPYHLRANTAQMDEKAVKLVCAAALAGGGNRPLLLILDELGRNLGSEHRREAVALFERIGADCNITVVGALQDDMERYAINASGLYIKLRRSSDAMPYNEAPVVTGSEANHARVELLHDWLSAYRPNRDELIGAGAGD